MEIGKYEVAEVRFIVNMEGKQTNKKNAHTETLILTMISCAIAPLIANWLDTVLGIDKNPWSSERLMVLFFSALSGTVIWHKICRIYKKSNLNKKGFDITNAGAQAQLVWTMPSLMVLMFYKSIFGATMSIIFFIVAVWILWRDHAEVAFNKYTYISIVIYTILVIFFDIIAPMKIHLIDWLKVVPILFVINFITWICGEYFERWIRKKIEKYN